MCCLAEAILIKRCVSKMTHFIKQIINFLTPVNVDHLIALLISQCFQILLAPRMYPGWDFVVGIIDRKDMLHMGIFLLNDELYAVCVMMFVRFDMIHF